MAGPFGTKSMFGSVYSIPAISSYSLAHIHTAVIGQAGMHELQSFPLSP